jgi:hypothetical protein
VDGAGERSAHRGVLPDGTQIAFAALDLSAYPEGEAVPRIYTIDVAGGEPHPIANASGYLTDWVRN